ncbi:hypothetical protein LINPERHAP2_LOCUS14608, partial [Linum perenne]
MNRFRATLAEPPSSRACLHFSLNFLTFSLISLPSSINPLIPSSISSLLTVITSSSSIPNSLLYSILMSTPNPHSFTTSKAFSCCSPSIGHVAIGTPNHRLSSIEFHPQCDTNPPIDGCASIAVCGAHPMIFPTPEVLSRNPS